MVTNVVSVSLALNDISQLLYMVVLVTRGFVSGCGPTKPLLDTSQQRGIRIPWPYKGTVSSPGYTLRDSTLRLIPLRLVSPNSLRTSRSLKYYFPRL